MAFTIEKANKILIAIELAGLLDELNSPRIREICRRVKVSGSVMTEALITADIIERVKLGQYELVVGGKKNEDRLEHFRAIALQIYAENAEAERRRKAKVDGVDVQQEPEPEPDPVKPESVLDARVARLEKLVEVLLRRAGVPHTQLKLANG